jgi:hypothetical protein
VLGTVAALALLAAPAPAVARVLKLWPFFEYRSDPEAGTESLRVLGPLLEYRLDPEYRHFALRPLLSIRQARVGHDDEVHVLYPLLSSRWAPEEQTTKGLGGLVTYRTAVDEDDERRLLRQRVYVLPVYFYDWERGVGPRASILPFYGDFANVLGYDRVQTVLFPGYLRLDRDSVERRYVLFPVFGRVGGEAHGGQAWPFYGRTTHGERAEEGFVFWPVYSWKTRPRRGGIERHVSVFPFYSHLAGPTRELTAYGGTLYTHAIDHETERETFGVLWPLSVYERNVATGARTAFRLFPFYGERRGGSLEARFVAWPLYRRRVVEEADTRIARTDSFFVLYSDEERSDRAEETESHLRTLFPLYRAEREDGRRDGGVLAVLDALLPSDAAIDEVYAPLWQAYAWDGSLRAPTWSIAWGAITHGDGETIPPWRFDRRDAEPAGDGPPLSSAR